MSTTPSRAWLHRDNGTILRVPPGGLRIGRRADCHVVLEDPEASLIHAIVSGAGPGVEVVSVGRNPTRVNGEEVRGAALLADRDTLEVPGATFVARVSRGRPWNGRSWWIEHPDGHKYGLRQLPSTAGDGEDDDLRVRGWPPAAATFYAADGAVAVELGAPGVLNDEALPFGAVEVLETFDRLAFNGVEVHLRSIDDVTRGGVTMSAQADAGARRALFAFRPAGGVLTVDFGDGPTSVELAELRARLVAALLQPPRNYAPGEHIPDEVLIKAIWPGTSGRDRVDLNVLIHRTRKDLVRVGINPARLIERPRQGGSTRICLAPEAEVNVE